MTSKSKTMDSEKHTDAPNGIYQKILEVQKKAEGIPKRGFNAFHKYYYATEADILSVKTILNQIGLIVLPTTLKEETGFKPDGKNWAAVTLLFRVVDAATGESVEAQFTGYAEDNFDKAIYKATTGANKYFYLKFFGIATEDDPEREDAAPPRYTPAKAPVLKRNVSFKQNETLTKPALTDEHKNRALIEANKILALQKHYHLSNEEVLQAGEIHSIKTLAEAGDADLLAQAYSKLSEHVQSRKSASSA